jgi:hypothetical protein
MDGGGCLGRHRPFRSLWRGCIWCWRRVRMLFAFVIVDISVGGVRHTVPASDELAGGRRGRRRDGGNENMPGEGRSGRHVCLGCVVLLTCVLVCACVRSVVPIASAWERGLSILCVRAVRLVNRQMVGILVGKLTEIRGGSVAMDTTGLRLGTDCVEVQSCQALMQATSLQTG